VKSEASAFRGGLKRLHIIHHLPPSLRPNMSHVLIFRITILLNSSSKAHPPLFEGIVLIKESISFLSVGG